MNLDEFKLVPPVSRCATGELPPISTGPGAHALGSMCPSRGGRYNPGPGRPKSEPPSASQRPATHLGRPGMPLSESLRRHWAHRGHPPSALTEVSYRGHAAAGIRRQLGLTEAPDSELEKNEPHAGGPSDRSASKRQPQKGRPVISMPEDHGLVTGTSRRHARMNRPGAASCKHFATRVGWQAPSPTPVRQPAQSSRPAPERHLFGCKRGAAARPVSQTWIKLACREQPQCTMCAQIEDERSISLFAGWSTVSWQRRVPSAGSRDTLGAMKRQKD